MTNGNSFIAKPIKVFLDLAAVIANGLSGFHPATLAVLGYGSYVLIGWILLALPFAQEKTVGALDNLFIAASAVSTTGLVTVSVSDSYTFWGELIVLGLIQLGGIGYMTFGSFVILSRKPGLSEVRSHIGQTVFSLPGSFSIDQFIRRVVLFTLVIELAGVAALYPIFSQAGEPHALWSAVFHSVSAFCTAGFGLYNNSFESYADNFWLNAVVAVLSYLGAVGFIVCVDVWRKLSGESKSITLTSRIILWMTFWMALVGTFLLFITEPSIHSEAPYERLMAAFFQAMTAMTTVGFNTIPIGALSKASLLLIVALMVVGASPSGTGGGLKTTTFSALWGVMWSTLRGRRDVRFWGRPVPLERVWSAVASLGMYLTALVVGAYLLELSESSGFIENLFEAASALGTVGLSMGITGALTPIGKLVIIALMFLGRLGPLTFGIALFFRKGETDEVQDNDLVV